MSRPESVPRDGESVHREYILDVRIVTVAPDGADAPRYRFEAPQHRGEEFDSVADAELYADVYFDVNGFQEDGTGDRGVPPEIIQAGRDTLAAYFRTQRYADTAWVASFFGKEPGQIERYIETVRARAEEVREGAVERGVA
ncbi:hypothetical protein [Haloglomus halophilum]|jgi:hypothetical protein|uniref:hypothetical protein n=1 Tax=Haloglomus halophilum TaxID=2962672 RepID=UPI0020C9EFDC|nr:hypothetical protein [Haloglomus halophilum]